MLLFYDQLVSACAMPTGGKQKTLEKQSDSKELPTNGSRHRKFLALNCVPLVPKVHGCRCQ
jgi:hypothetical protein